MRLLFVIDSLGGSGAEHSTAAMLPWLREQGHELEVATLYDAGFGDEDRLRDAGFDVRPLAADRFVGRVRALRQRIREFEPDVIHTALFNSDMIGRIASYRSGAAVVSSLVNTPYDPGRRADPAVRAWKIRILQAVDAATIRCFVDRLHAVSAGVADANSRALRFPVDRIDVAERGRSRHQFGEPSPARRERVRASMGIAETTAVVLAVGRQEHQKAHVDLIAATTSLQDLVPDVAVMIAGREGNASSEIARALATHPRAARAVTLLGHRHDVPDLIAAADVLVIASLYEGTAGVALEAMALECPVICTRVAGVDGILRHGDNAVLVPVSNPPELAAAIAGLLADPGRRQRMVDVGRREFDERFTIEAAAARIEHVYQRAIDTRARS